MRRMKPEPRSAAVAPSPAVEPPSAVAPPSVGPPVESVAAPLVGAPIDETVAPAVAEEDVFSGPPSQASVYAAPEPDPEAEVDPEPEPDPAPEADPQPDADSGDDEPTGIDWGRPAVIALMLFPGALVIFMGFNAGGFFPGTPALGALMVSQLLLGRVLLAQEPLEGLGWGTLAAIAAFAMYTLVTLASGAWSHATARALLSFDRDLMYLLMLVLFGTIKPTASDLRWLIRGLAVGFGVLCIAGLASRVLPNVWHTAPNIVDERLSYPLTYWNALGIVAALGIVLSFHLTSSVDEHWLVRIAAAVIVPLEAVTLYFTFSRSSMAVCVIALIVYVFVARPRALLGAVLATAPVTGLVVKVAYDANLLATPNPTTPAALVQAHHVAVVLGVGIAVTIAVRAIAVRLFDPRALGQKIWGRVRPSHRAELIAGSVVVLIGLGLVFNVPQTLSNDWRQFVNGAPTPTSDLRARLNSLSSNGRTALWNVAIDAFDAKPLNGSGAGTYQNLWLKGEPVYEYNVNAHSIYFETLAELGLLGIVPLVALMLGVLVGLFRRCRGELRAVYAVLGVTGLAVALHTGVDWDWQMPATTLGFFAAAGLALGPGRRLRRNWIPGGNGRAALAIGCLLAAALPVMILASQSRVHAAEVDLANGRCEDATQVALSAISWMPARPEPYEVIGYCDLERGFPKLGVQAMQEAVSHDPDSWETHFSLALAQAGAGVKPIQEARTALRMNPKSTLTNQAIHQFTPSDQARWAQEASKLRTEALSTDQLAISPV